MRELSTLHFGSQDAFEAWLQANHASSPGLWVKFAKKASGIESVTYHQAVDVALCYGWIDGQRDVFDAEYFIQRFTPRQPRSKWSQRNTVHIARLMEEGRMRPAGLLQVERAQADGRWDAAYPGARLAQVPDDLRHALAKNDRARDFFETLDSTNRYAIIYRVQTAGKPETRARRIEKFVSMLADHQKLHS